MANDPSVMRASSPQPGADAPDFPPERAGASLVCDMTSVRFGITASPSDTLFEPKAPADGECAAAPLFSDRTLKRAFCLAMILGTAAPMTLVAAFAGEPGGGDQAFGIQLIFLVLFFARGHVGLTALVYLDASFRKIARLHRLRLVIVPALLLTLLPPVLMISETLMRAAIFIVITWNVWHFNKQNLGILTLVSITEGSRSPTPFEKRLINLACALAIVCFCPLQFLTHLEDQPAWAAGLVDATASYLLYPFIGLMVIGACHLLLTAERSNLFRSAFFLIALAMFGPVFILPGSATVFAIGQATAHGIQYILIMYLTTIAAGSGASRKLIERQLGAVTLGRRVGLTRAIAGVLTSITLLAWALFVFNGGAVSAFLDDQLGTSFILHWAEGFAIAALYAHFVVDGGAFRLSEAPQREWLRSRLAFLMRR